MNEERQQSTYRQFVSPILAMVAAFVVYYCMYGFRKPYGAATWDGTLFDTTISIKTALAVSQIIGYALAKLIGTRVCSGVAYGRIVYVLLGCMVSALLSLLALPYLGDYMFVAMFFNGLSLGMVWGFVMRPLEGRLMTEMLIAGLCVSFIVASGDVKSMGKWLMNTDWFMQTFGDNEAWMPFVTATVYFPFLVAAAFYLFSLPEPTQLDKNRRSERKSMESKDRRFFLRHHLTLIVPLAIGYFLLTAYRDYRDTFQADIFLTLGITDDSAFSSTERLVSLGVIGVLSVFIFFRNSFVALVACHIVMAGGLIGCGVATWMLKQEMLTGYQWMVYAGLGAYVTYIAYHCIIFERMVAYTRSPGNAVYAMMIFDFVGYVAAILFMVVAEFFKDSNQLEILTAFTWGLMIFGAGAILFSMFRIGSLERIDDPNQNTLESAS